MELGAQNYNGHDLDLFFKKFNEGRLNDRPKLISIDGGESLHNLASSRSY